MTPSSKLSLRPQNIFVAATLALATVALSGCVGSARLVLRTPVADQCVKAGLDGCEEITEGAILYAEGRKEEARVKAIAGAQKNSPKKLRQYAKLISSMKDLPGVAPHVAPLTEFADLLLVPPGENEKLRGVAAPSAPTTQTASADESYENTTFASSGKVRETMDDSSQSRLRDGVVASPVLPMKVCELAWGPGVRCETVIRGPLVVSDLHSLGTSCQGQFAAVLRDNLPRFRLEGPFSIHGARFILGEKDVLVVGQVPSQSPKPSPSKNPKSSKSLSDELSLDEEDPSYSCKLYFSGEAL